MEQRVLVIEDELVLHTLYKRLMRNSSTVMDFVSNLEDALSSIDAHNYDAIITDLRLTPTNENEGLQIIHHVIDKGLQCPIILTTGSAAYSAIPSVDDYENFFLLLKPFDKSKFKQTLLDAGISVDDI